MTDSGKNWKEEIKAVSKTGRDVIRRLFPFLIYFFR